MSDGLGPSNLAVQIEAAFPGIWAQMDKAQPAGCVPGSYPVGLDKMRSLRPGEELPGAIPLRMLRLAGQAERGEWDQLVREGLDPNTSFISYSAKATRLMAAWRTFKLEYRMDGALFGQLMDTPLKGVPPASIFQRLPVPCFYLSWPEDRSSMPDALRACLQTMGVAHGALIHSDGKTLTIQPLFGRQSFQQHLSISLSEQSIEDAVQADLDRIWQASRNMLERHPNTAHEDIAQALDTAHERHEAYRPIAHQFWMGLVSTVLYLCSEKPDVSDRPILRPKICRLGKMIRIVPPAGEQCLDIGKRIGSVFRKVTQHPEEGESSRNGSQILLRPYIRRAHWHSYWIGPKPNQFIVLKWISPILVNARTETQLVETVHPVV